MDHVVELNRTAAGRSAWWKQFWAGLTRFAEGVEADQAGVMADRLARIEARLAAIETARRGK